LLLVFACYTVAYVYLICGGKMSLSVRDPKVSLSHSSPLGEVSTFSETQAQIGYSTVDSITTHPEANSEASIAGALKNQAKIGKTSNDIQLLSNIFSKVKDIIKELMQLGY
jgi:hypothetical protein